MKLPSKFNYTDSGAEFQGSGTHRTKLWRIMDAEKPLVLWIMLNPSEANELDNDPTIRRITHFTEQFGYGGFYVGNLFSKVSSNPKDILEWLKYASKASQDIWKRKNDKAIDDMVKLCSPRDIIFGWGSNGGRELLQQRAMEIIKKFPYAKCLNTCDNLHPGHPLYLANSKELIPYNFDPSTFKRIRKW